MTDKIFIGLMTAAIIVTMIFTSQVNSQTGHTAASQQVQVDVLVPVTVINESTRCRTRVQPEIGYPDGCPIGRY